MSSLRLLCIVAAQTTFVPTTTCLGTCASNHPEVASASIMLLAMLGDFEQVPGLSQA